MQYTYCFNNKYSISVSFLTVCRMKCVGITIPSSTCQSFCRFFFSTFLSGLVCSGNPRPPRPQKGMAAMRLEILRTLLMKIFRSKRRRRSRRRRSPRSTCFRCTAFENQTWYGSKILGGGGVSFLLNGNNF